MEEATNEKLIQPSIFDTDKIKNLKELLTELLLKYQETVEAEKVNEELEQIKKKEGEDVIVDANFGKPMTNAEQFKDMSCSIKIGKKRTYNEALTTDGAKNTDSSDSNDLKRRKLADGEVGVIDPKITGADTNVESDKENQVNV